MRKNIWYKRCTIAIIFALIFFAGCAKSPQSSKGLQVYSMNTSIGAVGDDDETYDKQRLYFALSLCNDSDEDIYISFVEPLLNTEINGRVISGDTRVDVKQKAAARSSIEIEGEFIFDAQNLSKQDIIALEPIITGFRVGTEQIIELNE